jgi:hypothetical protein
MVLLKTATIPKAIISLISTTGGRIKTLAMLPIMALRKKWMSGGLTILHHQ